MISLFYVAAATCNDIFGCISPPVNGQGGDPVASISSLFTVIISAVITIASLVTLFFMLSGGFDWITSNGEKEKITKAQQKITYAVIGIIFIVLSFSIFGVVAGNMLGIIELTGSGFKFKIPSVTL
jgi:hypothetical protein